MRGVERERLGGFIDAQLIETEVIIDACQTGATRCAILIELLATAIDRAIVVPLDRGLQILQGLAGSVFGLLPDRIVEIGRWIWWIQLLGDRELVRIQRVPFLFEIRLAELCPR